MPPKSDYVQRLLQAEETRNRIIAEARARKQAKLKQAKADADKAVVDFKKEKDAELAQFKVSLASGAESEKLALVHDTEKQIEAVRKVSSERMPKVVDMMTELICTVPRS